MKSETETLLLREVAPRLRAAIPKTVPMVDADDTEELVQDGVVIAIHLHRNARKARKKVTGGNLAHYALLSLRAGRRSTGFRKSDVLRPAAQLSGHTRVQSMDEAIHQTDGGYELTLHDCLAAPVDDPATTASRRLDWGSVIASLDKKTKAVLIALVEGRELTLLVSKFDRSRSALQDNKRRLGRTIQEHLGADILQQVQTQPAWRSTIGAAPLAQFGNGSPARRSGGRRNKRTWKGTRGLFLSS
jgi:hypothetical protein